MIQAGVQLEYSSQYFPVWDETRGIGETESDSFHHFPGTDIYELTRVRVSTGNNTKKNLKDTSGENRNFRHKAYHGHLDSLDSDRLFRLRPKVKNEEITDCTT